MKLTMVVQKHLGVGVMRALPRAAFTAQELAAGKDVVQVSLSRKAGGCVFALRDLEHHDEHAPAWNINGTAPVMCTDPSATMQGYADRIVADVKASGIDVEVEVVEQVFESAAAQDDIAEDDDADDSGDAGCPKPAKPAEDWGKYGVN